MPITFNANEIFQIAEQIERNGARFYRKAADSASDKETKQMFLEMADMEAGHLKTFEHMRRYLTYKEKAATVFDPDNEASIYLRTMADARGSEGKKSPTEELTGAESIEEILKIALSAEKDSVIYYFGLRSFVPPRAGRDKIEAIIAEEIKHITTLNKMLVSVQKG
ncbi:MAG: rubrerythrin [Planctomycetota bacterium]|nr:MAG: rubrerythrin [Planctomycetota bacterium]